MQSIPPIPLGEHALHMWTAHHAMCSACSAKTLSELAEISEAYALAIEVVAASASRTMGNFAKATVEVSRTEAILTGFIVGLTLVEHAILSGYNVQAAALVRQELEAIAALEELRIGKRREGKTPNVSNIPSIPGTAYGDLSKATHFADTPTLRQLGTYNGPVPDGPGPMETWLLSPQHVPNTTKQLFALHTLLLLHFAQYQSAHFSELYGTESSSSEVAAFIRSHNLLELAGVIECDA